MLEMRLKHSVNVRYASWLYDRSINGYVYLGTSSIVSRQCNTLCGVPYALAGPTLMMLVAKSSILVLELHKSVYSIIVCAEEELKQARAADI
jgi:hypothetical protein